MKKRILCIALSICLALISVPTTAFAETYGNINGLKYTIYDNGEVTITGYTGSETEVEIPRKIDGNPVTSIKHYAFNNCTSIERLTIPNSVTSIEEGAFYNCTSLASIEIPNSVIDIGNLTFTKCTSLTSISVDEDNTAYSSINGVLYNKDKTVLIKYPEGNSSLSYNIPNGIKSISNYAFGICTNLTNITIPDSVTAIGYYAFYYCTNLTNIEIPNSVTSIKESTFSNCTSLKSITIPYGVTSIKEYAFENCTSLESIFLPDTLSDVGYRAIPNTASQARYSLDESEDEITITKIDLTDDKPVNIPDKICGYPIIAVVKSEQPKVGEHTCISDGTANCLIKANCTIAGEEYGEVDSSKHNLEKISAKAATVTETGNIEYWHCKDCGKYFSNENGTNEITLADTITKKLPPEIIENDRQSITQGDSNTKSPKTGNDSMALLWVALLFVGGCFVTVTSVCNSKKKKRSK